MSPVNEQNLIELKTACVLGERWPVKPFNGQFPDPRFTTEIVRYQVSFEYRRYLIESERNLTVITFDHYFLYKGTPKQFQEWGRKKGGENIARHIIDLVNSLIDLVQVTFEETKDNPFPHIRRVGIRDFVSIDTLYGAQRQNLISFAAPQIDARNAERAIGQVSKISFSTADVLPKEKIRIIRAVELLNSGYHTEAMLMSFSLLDSLVENALKKLLGDRGVGDPKFFLELLRSERMKTYLGPLLKVLTG